MTDDTPLTDEPVFAIALKRIKKVAPRLSDALVTHTARTIAEEVARLPCRSTPAAVGHQERARAVLLRAFGVGQFTEGQCTALASAFAAVAEAEKERCAKVADGWLNEYAGFSPQYVSANKWANDAVRDIAAAIRGLKDE